MTVQRLTAICTTIARPKCATEFLHSLRSVCPDLPVILAEQAEVPALQEICTELDVQHLALPFDCGVSSARNLMLREVNTDYFVLMEEDFRFPVAPDFGTFMRFLDSYPDFLCVTGSLENRKAKPRGSYLARNFAFDDAGDGLITLPIDIVGTQTTTFENVAVNTCHMGPNWGVFRCAPFVQRELGWDELFKTSGEHIDFYLRLRKDHSNLKVGYCETLRCQHVDTEEDEYSVLRRRPEWLDLFRAKWPFRYRFDLGGSLRLFEQYDTTLPVPSARVDRLTKLLREERAKAARLERELQSLRA